MGDGDYMWAFQKIVMPVATEFNPDLVISKSGSSLVVGFF
jgi:Deacetylases, including yeast histone deacetylase and acetoin utilization protein